MKDVIIGIDIGGTHLRIVHEGFAIAAVANDNSPTMMMRAAA